MTKVGRPTALTENVLQKLEAAFHIDCTDEEACASAGIAESTFYLHLKNDEKFSERMKRAKKWAIQSARAILFNAMEKDPKLALEVVKRRDKARYSDRTEQTGGLQVWPALFPV